MAVRAADVDFSKSTMAYPMPKKPEPVFVDQDIDYAKSTGAFPMYDDRNAPEVQAVHLVAELDPGFITPGPASAGHPDVVAEQRDALGLSEDASGDADAGYEARPSTVPVVGADGVDRRDVYESGYRVEHEPEPEVDGEEITESEEGDVPDETSADAKEVDAAQVEAKVVEPPKSSRTRGRARATAK